MANTFNLAGTSLDALNNPAYVGRYMLTRVTSVGTDTEDAASYPQKTVSHLIDENGDWSAVGLWVNGDSGIQSFYEIVEPSGQSNKFVFPSATEGTTVRYEFALENYLNTESAAQTTPALATHIADQSNPHGVTFTQTGAQEQSAILDATTASYTTADQAIVDTALQDADIGLNVQAYSGVLSATTASYTTAEASKLSGIEAAADVTDATNVAAAGGYVSGGTDVAIADGGTGASTEAAARTNLEFQTNVTGDTTAVGVTSYTVLTTDHTLTVDDTAIGGNVTINLPAAATVGGGFELVTKKTGSTYTVTLDGSGTETIDGELTQVMSIENSTVAIVSNGTNWDITQGQGTGIGNLQNLQIPTTAVTTTSYTSLIGDNALLVDDDTAGSTVTITLISAATAGNGFTLDIIKEGSTANVVVTGIGTLTEQGESITLKSNGTNWRII